MHAQQLFHSMQGGRSGCRFQCAEGQRHSAVVAEGEPGRETMRLDPLSRPAGEVVFRCAGGQAHRFDLAQGEGGPQAGACRFQKGFLGGKIRRCTGRFAGSLPPFRQAL